jgi:cobalt/nickel transport system ATP-binding protein
MFTWLWLPEDTPEILKNMANENVYELRGVSHSYLGRFPALVEINLNICKGEKVALLGANGSGKSTLLMVLAGLIYPKDGISKFSGKELKEDSFLDASFQKDFRRRVGIVFQNSDIQLFNSNVEDEMLFGLLQLKLSREEISSRLKKYMELMDIAHLRDRHPQYMSVGEKKRVAIASVLAMEPEVILLDEPSAGLDPRTCRKLIDTIAELGDKGYTVVTATQDVHIVPELADRAIVLSEEKRVVQDGSVSDILQNNEFLEKHNLIHVHAHRHEGKVHVHPHEHPSHDHPHPHQ